ncbi:ArsR family transcriptional regulator [Nonomuraea sp. NPDC050783]|uniref:arsenate reductase/protein-tyrosine-phosphatase family protein n=1 Tax=Nonomuraea sp. NPDC050783 TaxID=3154634 RepID=UPI0034660499
MVPSGQAAPPPFVHLAAHPVRWRLLSELAHSDLRVRELVARLGEPQNLISYHLRLLRSGGLVRARRSSFDGRDSYYRLDLERCAGALADAGAALHPALRLVPDRPAASSENSPRPSVLFVCTGNSARSPIAEALLRHHSGDRAEVASAGSHPKPHFHPGAVRVLRRRYGIDLAGRGPRHLDTMTGRRFDYVISLCDRVREVCPEFDGRTRRIHWSIADPADPADPANSAGLADPAASGGGTARAGDAAFEAAAAELDTRIRYLLPALTPTPHREVQP